MKTRCVIVAGGECTADDLGLITDKDFVIAADSGLETLNLNGLTPDLIVGDFDSYSGPLPSGVDVITLPTHKDDTDLLYASRKGVEKGFSNFLILGGYGSRPDQNFAMLETLLWIKTNCSAADVLARSGKFSAFLLLNETKELLVSEDEYLSVFPLDGTAEGVSVSGAEYPLENATLTSDYPLGVSNRVIGGGNAVISVKKGALLVFKVNKDI